MRWSLPCFVLLIGCGLLPAAPLRPDVDPPGRSAPPGALRAEADNYARQLVYVLNEIDRNYVRPVPRGQLIQAALAGMSEAARVPAPAALRADIDAALAAMAKAGNDHELQQLFVRVREGLGNPEPLQGTGAILASVRAMARTLDPHSGILSPEEARRGSASQNYGVGLELEESGDDAPVVIKEVFPGGPAQRAGLRPGDEITHLNDEAVKGGAVMRARLNLIAPRPEGIPPPIDPAASAPRVTLTWRRGSAGEPRKVTLDPQIFRPETVLGVIRQDSNAWDFWLDRKQRIAHVRIANLTDGTASELRQAMHDLKGQGLRGLLLDLRWCPGGYLNEALDVAQLFLGECTVATVKGRVQGEDTFRSVRDENKLLDLPLLVLVNAETSGGAELIAAALQDNGRATVAGQRTRGKASVQTTTGLPVPGAHGLKLTSGTFFRPSGKNLHRFSDSKPGDDWGVRPDPGLEFRVSPDLDRQLKSWWGELTIRPGPSREALPLDHPHGDPQRQAALEALLRSIK